MVLDSSENWNSQTDNEDYGSQKRKIDQIIIPLTKCKISKVQHNTIDFEILKNELFPPLKLCVSIFDFMRKREDDYMNDKQYTWITAPYRAVGINAMVSVK